MLGTQLVIDPETGKVVEAGPAVEYSQNRKSYPYSALTLILNEIDILVAFVQLAFIVGDVYDVF